MEARVTEPEGPDARSGPPAPASRSGLPLHRLPLLRGVLQAPPLTVDLNPCAFLAEGEGANSEEVALRPNPPPEPLLLEHSLACKKFLLSERVKLRDLSKSYFSTWRAFLPAESTCSRRVPRDP